MDSFVESLKGKESENRYFSKAQDTVVNYTNMQLEHKDRFEIIVVPVLVSCSNTMERHVQEQN